ncbi:hypothetical protein Tco_0738987 [Tanacetum coccineum]
MLERGSYIPWPERPETEDDFMGDDLKQYEADIDAMNLILISIPNDIYNFVDSVVQANRVNIQSRNVGNDGRIATRSYNVQDETAKGSNVQKETRNLQRTIQTSFAGNAKNFQ